MEEKLVSIIIPIYNSEKYLIPCLKSVSNQTYKNLEIILIDDGSTDNSYKICQEYSFKDKRIKLVHKQNEGVSLARNCGLELSSGEYIIFVDSDDYIEPELVEICIKQQITTRANLITFGYYHGKNCFIENKKGGEISQIDFAKKIEGYKSSILGFLWNKVFLADIIKSNSLQFKADAALCEDDLFCHEYLAHCTKIWYIPQALYHYEIHEDSFTNAKITSKIFSVFNVYKIIIDFCKKQYNDEVLNNLVMANYYSHYILNLRRILKELTAEERTDYKYIYEFVKNNISNILKNKYLKFRRKILAIGLIYFKKYQ